MSHNVFVNTHTHAIFADSHKPLYIINPTLQTLFTCPLSIFIFTIKLIVDSVKMMTDFLKSRHVGYHVFCSCIEANNKFFSSVIPLTLCWSLWY